MRSWLLVFALLLVACPPVDDDDAGDDDDVTDDDDTVDDDDTGDDDDTTDDVPPIDCDWLDSDNCWKQLMETGRDCVPEGKQGTFDAAGTLCTYDDGSTVELLLGATASTWADVEDKGFLLTRGDGTVCAEFYEEQTTGEGIGEWYAEILGARFTATSTTGFEQVWECPDGTQWQLTQDIVDCENWLFRVPGLISTSTDEFFGAGFGGVQPPLGVFGCAIP